MYVSQSLWERKRVTSRAQNLDEETLTEIVTYMYTGKWPDERCHDLTRIRGKTKMEACSHNFSPTLHFESQQQTSSIFVTRCNPTWLNALTPYRRRMWYSWRCSDSDSALLAVCMRTKVRSVCLAKETSEDGRPHAVFRAYHTPVVIRNLAPT